MTKDWRDACVRLWGEHWMAPLADVLGVSRRTVERWNKGDVQIPAETEHDIANIGPSSEEPIESRAYGELLRRHAKGESLSEIAEWVYIQQDALGTLEADIGLYKSIPVLTRDE